MKAINNILLKVIMSSGLFLNATAQDDLTGLHIPEEFGQATSLTYMSSNISSEFNANCCDLEEMMAGETETETAQTKSWIEKENTITIAELPKAILKTLMKEYNAYALLKVEAIETSVREAYKLRVVQENSQWDIFISSNGDILMEERVNS